MTRFCMKHTVQQLLADLNFHLVELGSSHLKLNAITVGLRDSFMRI